MLHRLAGLLAGALFWSAAATAQDQRYLEAYLDQMHDVRIVSTDHVLH